LASVLLHFGLLPLAFNTWALWGVGQLIEKLFGPDHVLGHLPSFAGLSGRGQSVGSWA